MIYGLPKLAGTHPALWAAVGYMGFKSAYDWKVTEGVRSNQKELYAIGRTVDVGQPVVTDAKEGESPHEYGLAIDLYPTLDKGYSIILDTNHPAFDEKTKLLASFPSVREISISSGQDRPHVEVNEWQHLKDWKKTYLAVGIATACFALFFVR